MMKKFIKEKIVATVLSKAPINLLHKITRTNLILPFYHIVSDNEAPHVKHLYKFRNSKQFKEDIDIFLKYYSPISLHDLIDNIKNNGFLDNRSFLLTFDDGFRQQYDEIAPILIEKGVPATFFLTVDFLDNQNLLYRHKASILIEHFEKVSDLSAKELVEKLLLDNQIRYSYFKTSILSIKKSQEHILDEIAGLLNYDFSKYLSSYKPFLTSDQVNALIKSGFTIGAHSIDHPLYSAISLEDQLHQTIESVIKIKKEFSLEYGAFAFPHTDSGVSKEYFDKIQLDANVDISFGGSGLVHDNCPKNIQRFNMEGTSMPARKIISIEYARKMFNVLTGKNEIRRN